MVGKHNEINGKFVDIKVAEDGQTRQRVQERSSCKVFVGGIENTVSTEELRDYFQNFGDVKEAVVLKNINTNISRGFGFVTFEDYRIADQLIRDNNCVLKGKRMDVKPAEPKENSPSKPDDRGMRGHGRYDAPHDRNRGMPRGRRDDYPPPQDHYSAPRSGYQRGGYQRDNYPPPEPEYAPRYNQYPPQSQSRFSNYAPPPAPVEPQPAAATIAPYAPPPSKGSYQGSYGAPQGYPPANEAKMDSYGKSGGGYMPSYGQEEYPGGYANPGYAPYQQNAPRGGSKHPKDHYGGGYNKPQQQPGYGGGYGKPHGDQYSGGSGRNYRYKPY